MHWLKDTVEDTFCLYLLSSCVSTLILAWLSSRSQVSAAVSGDASGIQQKKYYLSLYINFKGKNNKTESFPDSLRALARLCPMSMLKLTTDQEQSHHDGPWPIRLSLLRLEPASPEAHGCAECGSQNKFTVLFPNEYTEAPRSYITCRTSHVVCYCIRLPTQMCLTQNVSSLDHPTVLLEVARLDREGPTSLQGCCYPLTIIITVAITLHQNHLQIVQMLCNH